MVATDKPIDRRVDRTQRLLHEALVSLIHERGWTAIGVQDICARAAVGRSTFYVHFADKEDLLLSGFDRFQLRLRDHVRAAGKQPLAFVRPLVEHVRDHRRLYVALAGKRGGPAVQKRLLGLLMQMLEPDIARVMPSGARRTAVLRYTAGAVLELIVWWLDTRTGLNAGEVEQLVTQLTMAVLAQAATPRLI